MGPLIVSVADATPQIAESAWVAPGAVVAGRVSIGADSSVFYGAVLRGDCHEIVIGERTNIQDGVVVHVDDAAATVVGDDVSVGHRAVLHGCTIGDGCLIGMSATVMTGATIGPGTLVAAGALVTPGKTFGSGVLVAGVPAREVRALTEAEREHLVFNAAHYLGIAADHRAATAPAEPSTPTA